MHFEEASCAAAGDVVVRPVHQTDVVPRRGQCWVGWYLKSDVSEELVLERARPRIAKLAA